MTRARKAVSLVEGTRTVDLVIDLHGEVWKQFYAPPG